MAKAQCWLQSSLERVFPGSPAREASPFEVIAARNGRVSFQACIRNTSGSPLAASLSVDGPDDIDVRIRRVGYVPVAHFNTDTPESDLDGIGHLPGLAPDPLFPESSVFMGPFEAHSFWVSVSVPADIEPGVREINLQFEIGKERVGELSAKIDVRPFTIQLRHDFPVTHWFYADALCDWYKVEPFEEEFWEIVRLYMEDLVSHGNNCLYVPIFTPPTDGVKRPTQLLKVTTPDAGKYSFDFSDVLRWTRLARSAGAESFEWTHFFWQWGVKYALRIYRNNQDRDSLLWPPETGATSGIYKNFLVQFLPEFHRFLISEDLLECSYFHVSDEPHGDHIINYRAAREMLRELAPWMKVMDALSDVSYGKEGLTDMPIPVISTAPQYAEAGIPAWTYFCCGPRGEYLNRLIDTPLTKIRMSGWLFYRLKALGFLHWGYNYWYKSQTQQMIDPYTEQSGAAWPGWAYGDTFVVYPGADGPVDSIRWEIFAESLQDFAILQTADIDHDSDMLSEIKSYCDFPKSEDWIISAMKKLLG